jgi:hypothetical protein
MTLVGSLRRYWTRPRWRWFSRCPGWFEKAPNLLTLRARLVTEFSGKQVSVANVEKFVLLETAFRESHYKGILKTLEKEGGLTVPNPAPGRRAGTFGDPAMIVRFG